MQSHQPRREEAESRPTACNDGEIGGTIKGFKSQDVLPLRPVTGSSKSVIVPSTILIHHNQRAFGRPDVWVGPSNGARAKPLRSWRPKQTTLDATKQDCYPEPCRDDTSLFDDSIHTAPAIMSNVVGRYDQKSSARKAETLVAIVGTKDVAGNVAEQEDSAIRDIVISTRAKHCLDSSIHSVLTEDSKSRFSDAMEMWHSVASIDVKHQDSVSDRSPHEILSPSKRVSTYRAAWIAASKPPQWIVQEECDATEDDVGLSPHPPTSGKWNHDALRNIQAKQKISFLSSRPEFAYSGTPKGEEDETVPCLDDSVTSLSHHFNDSNHSFKTCVTSLSASSSHGAVERYHQKSGLIERGLNPTEMLPSKPGTSLDHGVLNDGGMKGSSPVVSPKKNIHAHRAHSRPDNWVGPRGKPAKRSWKVKRIVEASEIVSDDDDK
jgi:hypothetical protein